ncbi:MAG: 5'/3'-nucleotidase SurE [Myxococcota bacterium]|nr:5'/3'-nucleotidase SurE [Myxococcota bacterium]
MSKPFILLTNDDGYESEGLACLVQAVSSFATVAVVAPEVDMSAVSQRLTIRDPLRVKQRADLRWSVNGTPTDCVYLALAELLPQQPDLVVSGINHGPNLADDVMYSGTVAAAREAAATGVSALAVSQLSGTSWNFGPAAELAKQIIQLMLENWSGRRLLLNLNVPHTDGQGVMTVRWAPTGRRDYGRRVVKRADPVGRPYYWLGGNDFGHHSQPGSDCDVVAAGVATLTPLAMDFTDHGFLNQVCADEGDLL